MTATFQINLIEQPGGSDLLNDLERSSIELSVFADNIAFLLSNNPDSIDIAESPAVQSYQKRQVDTKLRYESQKRQLEKRYIPSCIWEKCNCSWTLDFKSGMVIVTLHDDIGIKLAQDNGIRVTLIE